MVKIALNPLGPPFDFLGAGSSGGPVDTLTGNDGVVITPSAGNINVVGSGVASSGVSTSGNIYTTGSGATLTVNETQAQFLTNYTQPGSYPYTATATDYYISANTVAGPISIILPSSPTMGRFFVVKDRIGNAEINHITVSAGGVTTIDGMPTYQIDGNYESSSFVFNGSGYETF